MNEESRFYSRRAALRVLSTGMALGAGVGACTPPKKPAPKAAKKPTEPEPAARATDAKVAAKTEPAAPEAAAPDTKPAVAEAKPMDPKPVEPKPVEPKPSAGASAGTDCAAEAKLDAASKQMRKALQYVSESKKAGQNCAKCLQWKAPEGGGACGGCKLFSGPVNAEGYCLSFAPGKA